jgi:hypothetical protein
MFCRLVAFDMVSVMRQRPTTTEILEGANANSPHVVQCRRKYVIPRTNGRVYEMIGWPVDARTVSTDDVHTLESTIGAILLAVLFYFMRFGIKKSTS